MNSKSQIDVRKRRLAGGAVYLYLTWKEDGISGYCCNTMFEQTMPFSDLAYAMTEIERHLDEDDTYRVAIGSPQFNKTKESAHYDAFYLLDILYRQNFGWQGVLYGGHQEKRPFKGLLELFQFLQSDQKKGWEKKVLHCKSG